MTSPPEFKMGYLCHIISAVFVVDISRVISVVFPIEFNCFGDVDSTVKRGTDGISRRRHVLSSRLGAKKSCEYIYI